MRKRVALPLIGFAWFYGYMVSPVPEHDPLPPRIVNVTREVPVEVEVPAMPEACADLVGRALEVKDQSFTYLAHVGSVETTVSDLRIALYYNDAELIERVKTNLSADETGISAATQRIAQLQFDINNLNIKCEESIR